MGVEDATWRNLGDNRDLIVFKNGVLSPLLFLRRYRRRYGPIGTTRAFQRTLERPYRWHSFGGINFQIFFSYWSDSGERDICVRGATRTFQRPFERSPKWRSLGDNWN
ncbi:hypothetical protein V1477_006652 [Vespula maculifrons]|uniref:Uncharacterized protein n=1 Tax=Vespula maculifrons TaxID=7453 RepID=A0ABD2CJG6_VESMC